MKKYTKFSLIALSLAAVSANASNDGIYISEKLGIHMPPNSSAFSSSTAATFGLGLKTASPWGIELGYSMARPYDAVNDNKAIFRYLQTNALYHFDVSERLRPFLAIGLGQGSITTAIGKQKQSGFNFGAGVKWEWMPRLDVRADIGILTNDNSQSLNQLISIGLDYRFFDLKKADQEVIVETAPAPAPASLDSDEDGVLDRNDRCPNSAAMENVDEYGCKVVVVPQPVEVSIELSINFANNSSIVPEAYLSEIQNVAMFMEKYPDTSVVVEGHTDDVGSPKYNAWLSERRAASVAKIIVESFGIQAKRVESKGFGESAPLVANDSEQNRSKNRRVVAVIKTFE